MTVAATPVTDGATRACVSLAPCAVTGDRAAMSHAVSLALGISFVVLAIAAVLLQAWLWSPKYWDPVAKKSHAPAQWMRVHRIVGYAYALIYVVMMWHMVPRLWGYAIELPARTVVHAVAAIVIGVILITKIAILRWFRHFEEAMPALGLALLVCTVVLGTLSIPFGLRAYSGVALTHDQRARVNRVLASIDADPPIDPRALSTAESLVQGRRVLTTQCTQCHDLRMILAEPRTGAAWHSLVLRMAAKPTIGAPIRDADVWAVTAYLVAITPTLQQASAARYDDLSRARQAAEIAAPRVDVSGPVVDRSTDAGVPAIDGGDTDASFADAGARVHRPRRVRADSGGVDAGVPLQPTVPSDEPDAAIVAPVAPPPVARLVYSAALGRELLTTRCEDCHGSDELDTHGGDDRAGWSAVVGRMIARGALLSADEARVLATYLAAVHPPDATRADVTSP